VAPLIPATSGQERRAYHSQGRRRLMAEELGEGSSR